MSDVADFCVHVDSTLKSQAEEVLPEIVLTMSGQAMSLAPSVQPRNDIYAELLEAQTEQLDGYRARNACEVLTDMERMIWEWSRLPE